jgi:hypothetical protein
MECLLGKVQAKMDSLIEGMIGEIKASHGKMKAIMKASLGRNEVCSRLSGSP